MADFNWDSFDKEAPHPDFSWDQFKTEGTPEAKSEVTAATTGLAQGALPFGLAGSLAGVGKASMDAITGVRGPLAGGTLSDLGDDYTQTKNQFENDAKTAETNHPLVSLTANAAPGLVGVGAAAKAVGAKLPPMSDLVKTAIMAKMSPYTLAKKLGGSAVNSLADAVASKIAAREAAPIAESIANEAAPLAVKEFTPTIQNQITDPIIKAATQELPSSAPAMKRVSGMFPVANRAYQQAAKTRYFAELAGESVAPEIESAAQSVGEPVSDAIKNAIVKRNKQITNPYFRDIFPVAKE